MVIKGRESMVKHRIQGMLKRYGYTLEEGIELIKEIIENGKRD